MTNIFHKLISESSAGSRKSSSKKSGFMAKSKSHHRGRVEDTSNTDHLTPNVDLDLPSRPNGLFQGKVLGSDETSPEGRVSGSPSLLQAVFGGSWSRRAGKHAQKLKLSLSTDNFFS